MVQESGVLALTEDHGWTSSSHMAARKLSVTPVQGIRYPLLNSVYTRHV